jgi:phytoene dehydrogenase-like protein
LAGEGVKAIRSAPTSKRRKQTAGPNLSYETSHFQPPEVGQQRDGDIFMGAFNAEQVMYNHFGYRTPIPNLYMAGSSGHPGGAISGGAGYITAGIIARDLGAKLWWKPADALSALGKISRAA